MDHRYKKALKEWRLPTPAHLIPTSIIIQPVNVVYIATTGVGIKCPLVNA